MQNVKVAVERPASGYEFYVHLLVPAATVPEFARAVSQIAEADCLTAGDLLRMPGYAHINNFCFSYAGAWWLAGEFVGGPHAYTNFSVCAEGENIKFSVNIVQCSAGLDHTKQVDPNLWWLDAANIFKELLTIAKDW